MAPSTLLFLGLALAGWYFSIRFIHEQGSFQDAQQRFNVSDLPDSSPQEPQASIVPEPQKKEEKQQQSAIGDVPFFAQAPRGKWKDPLFQNGCEEASVLMAMEWIRGGKIGDPKSIEEKMRAMESFENTALGNSTDTDLYDVKKIFEEYFGYHSISVESHVKLDAIKDALHQGGIVLAPTFGRALGNPYFTQPGPITHMVLIKGYDSAKKQFIVNDPGTRRGESYRYDEDVLYAALWGYPSSKEHATAAPKGNLKKEMLIVRRSPDSQQ